MDLRALHPRMWVRNRPTDPQWDAVLRSALKAGEPVKRIDNYTAMVGRLPVWIENWPYGYGSPYDSDIGDIRVLPSRSTALMLRDAVPVADSRLERYLLKRGVL